MNDYVKHSKRNFVVEGYPVPALPRTSRLYRNINRAFSPKFLTGWSPDIVHETYYSRRGVAPVGSKIIITVYDMIHELVPSLFSKRDRTSIYKREAVERADHVICISKSTQNDLIRFFGVPSEKTTVVHLGCNLSRTSSASSFGSQRPVLLYVGSRFGYKNFQRFITAFASRRELRDYYDLVAFGGGGFNRHERDMIRRLGLSLTQVKQIGGDDNVLASLYRQADMFVYPSLYEGFGIPPLEAMKFGCPVVCSNAGSIPEVVGSAAIQFDPLDEQAIATAMVQVSSNDTLRKRLSELGRARAEMFSWEKCAMETLDVYEGVLR